MHLGRGPATGRHQPRPSGRSPCTTTTDFCTPTLSRHAIGDRTQGLRRGADGSLEIDIAHQAPAATANWLPAPDGPFYLVLRVYKPRPGSEDWLPPALEPQP